MAKYPDEIKDAARALYLRQYTPKEIAEELNLPPRTIYHWAEKEQWAELIPVESVEKSIARRIDKLNNRDVKNALELEELRLLVSQHVKLLAQQNKHAEEMAKIHAGGVMPYRSRSRSRDDDGDSPTLSGEESGNRKRRKNDVSGITAEELDEKARSFLFEYQLYVRQNSALDWRFILKGRQEGFTYYFAWEGLETAILTGKNQIFFSASKPQAEVFRFYILELAQQHLGIELKGNPIRLSNGAVLRFLATNINTAQSYSGDLYGDEVFWIPKFSRLHEVASAMATHDEFRITYFSTPSSKTHQAYRVWTGEDWKEGDATRKDAVFPQDKALRKGGKLCPDQIWRYVITMEDAVKAGLGARVNIEKLRARYSRQSFAMLYMCEFVDSKDAVFKFSDLERAEVDSATWQDFNPGEARPFGNREVWGGFDPARSGDNSTFVIVAPPMLKGERFRVLAVYQWSGLNYHYQAEQIQGLMKRYNMTYIGIDTTGVGNGVYELVSRFAPREATPILYSVESKSRLVLKMVDAIERRRIEWGKDAIDEVSKTRADIAPSFMAIRRTATKSGGAMTFVAERSESTGHADVFFAISHAVINEPIDFEFDRPSTWAFGAAA